MQKLSSRAESLIRNGRDGLRPSRVARARVLEKLSEKLGPAVAHGAVSGAATAGWAFGPTRVILASSVGLGIAVGAAWFGLSSDAGPALPTVPATAMPSLPPARNEAPPEAVTSEPAPPAPSAVAPSEPRTSVRPAPAPNRLSEEIAILSRATSLLRAGRPAEALTTMEEHQAKFPRGVLSQERRAARAQALCSLGRLAEANTELARLSRTSPDSPNTLRAKQYCEQRSLKR